LILNKKSKTANWSTATSESEISDHERKILKKINRLDGETSCSNNLERTSVRSIIAGYQQRQLSSKPSYTAQGHIQGLSPGNSVVLRGKEDINSQISVESEVTESKVHTDILPVGSNEFQKVLPKANDMMESRKPMAAPPAPPLPPIPTHLKNSQLKLLNGDSGSSPISSNLSNGIHKRTLTTVTSTSGSIQDSSKHEATDAKFVPKGMVSRFPSGCFPQYLCCISPSHKKSISIEDTSLTPKIREHYGLLYKTITDNEIRNNNKIISKKTKAVIIYDFTEKFNVSGSTTEEFRTLKLNGHVGFDSLPHQLVRKCTERGFQFNLMCVGETGMGKTTLIESLFNMKLEFHPCNNELKTVELLSRTYDVVEGGIRLKLTIVETAGFGDQLDKDKSAQVIVDFINEQFEKYLKEELKIKRCLDYYDDTRIHACLYFISPTGHGFVYSFFFVNYGN
ncbi:unnamed protein product, partial [Wuchereria bancrofti]